MGVPPEDQSGHARLATDGDSENEVSESPPESPPESPSAYSADGDPSLYSQKTGQRSHDDLWTQTLTAIMDTYYRGMQTSDFSKYWMPTSLLSHENGVVTILCVDEWQRDWLEQREKIAERMLVGVRVFGKIVFVTGEKDVDNSQD